MRPLNQKEERNGDDACVRFVRRKLPFMANSHHHSFCELRTYPYHYEPDTDDEFDELIGEHQGDTEVIPTATSYNVLNANPTHRWIALEWKIRGIDETTVLNSIAYSMNIMAKKKYFMNRWETHCIASLMVPTCR